MFRNDSVDIQSLVDYVKDIKPYHTKLKDVTVEYTFNENLFARIYDRSHILSHLSSSWCNTYIADGIHNAYIIPPVSYPKITIATRLGITDTVNEDETVYHIPYNNGVAVYVDDVLQEEGVAYTVSDYNHSEITFLSGYEPVLNVLIKFVYVLFDQIFINVKLPDDIEGTWQTYDIIGYDPVTNIYGDVTDFSELSAWGVFPWGQGNWGNQFLFSQNDESITPANRFGYGESCKDYGYDEFPYDEDLYNPSEQRSPSNQFQRLEPVGFIRKKIGDDGYPRYTFEFCSTQPVNTIIDICVVQTDEHHDWVGTGITESLRVQDIIRFADTVNISIAENTNTYGFYDETLYDLLPYEDLVGSVLFTINDYLEEDSSTSVITEEIEMVINQTDYTPVYGWIGILDARWSSAVSYTYSGVGDPSIPQFNQGLVIYDFTESKWTVTCIGNEIFTVVGEVYGAITNYDTAPIINYDTQNPNPYLNMNIQHAHRKSPILFAPGDVFVISISQAYDNGGSFRLDDGTTYGDITTTQFSDYSGLLFPTQPVIRVTIDSEEINTIVFEILDNDGVSGNVIGFYVLNNVVGVNEFVIQPQYQDFYEVHKIRWRRTNPTGYFDITNIEVDAYTFVPTPSSGFGSGFGSGF